MSVEKMQTRLQSDEDLESSFPIIHSQEKVIHRITLSNLIGQLIDSFNIEKGYLFSIKAFSTNPRGALVGYLTEDRLRHGNPIKLLILTVAISSFLTLQLNFEDIVTQGMQQGMGNSQEAVNSNEVSKKIYGFYMNYYNFFMLLVLPFMSLSSYWIFRMSRFNFAEHLVINSFLVAIQNVIFILYFPIIYFLQSSLTVYMTLSIAFQFYFYMRTFRLVSIRGFLRSFLAISCGYFLYYASLIFLTVIYFKMR